jgi:hypothetical protein
MGIWSLWPTCTGKHRGRRTILPAITAITVLRRAEVIIIRYHHQTHLVRRLPRWFHQWRRLRFLSWKELWGLAWSWWSRPSKVKCSTPSRWNPKRWQLLCCSNIMWRKPLSSAYE